MRIRDAHGKFLYKYDFSIIFGPVMIWERNDGLWDITNYETTMESALIAGIVLDLFDFPLVSDFNLSGYLIRSSACSVKFSFLFEFLLLSPMLIIPFVVTWSPATGPLQHLTYDIML